VQLKSEQAEQSVIPVQRLGFVITVAIWLCAMFCVCLWMLMFLLAQTST